MFGVFQFGEPYYGDADVSPVFLLLTDAGSYLVTGSAALLLKDSLLLTSAGSYVITGSDSLLSFYGVTGHRMTLVRENYRVATMLSARRLVVIKEEPI